MAKPKLKKQKLRRKTKLDEVVTPALQKHWRNNHSAMSYLNKRFPDNDPTGDFLKGIVGERSA